MRLSLSNLMHWIVILLFFVTLFSAIVNTTFYSKEAIMDSFSITLPVAGVDIAPVDQLFMARLVRRSLWEFHFFIGVILFVSFVVLAYLSRKGTFLLLLVLAISTMFSTGTYLYFRDVGHFEQAFIQIVRTVHYYTAFFVVGLVIFHVIKVLAVFRNDPCKLGSRFTLLKMDSVKND